MGKSESLSQSWRRLKAKVYTWLPSIDLGVDVDFRDPQDSIPHIGSRPLEMVSDCTLPDRVVCISIEGRNKQEDSATPVQLELHSRIPPQIDDPSTVLEIVGLLKTASSDDLHEMLSAGMAGRSDLIEQCITTIVNSRPLLALIRNRERTLIGYVHVDRRQEEKKYLPELLLLMLNIGGWDYWSKQCFRLLNMQTKWKFLLRERSFFSTVQPTPRCQVFIKNCQD